MVHQVRQLSLLLYITMKPQNFLLPLTAMFFELSDESEAQLPSDRWLSEDGTVCVILWEMS